MQRQGSTTRSTEREFMDVSDPNYFAEIVRSMLGTMENAPKGAIAIVNQDGLLTFSPWLRWNDDLKQLAVGGGINGQNQARLGGDFVVTSNTTLANIAPSAKQPLTVSLASGIPYRIKAKIFTTSNIAGGVKLGFGCTGTFTSILAEALVTEAGVLIVPGTTRLTSTTLSTPLGDVTAVTTATITIEGIVILATRGDLSLQFAQNASNAAASTVLAGSFIQLTPMS